ncbi:MAG: hypothetical protein LAQ30_06295 [Acidobacteriia bacterium]|nr:hypothetical protein [Terriglobia bacterium]
MRRYTTLAAICALFVLLLATPAYSQGPFPSQCGALVPLAGQMPGTGPLGALPAGSTWAFVLHGETSTDIPIGVAGVFMVSTGPSRSNNATVGKLLIDETFSVGGSAVKINDLVAGEYDISTNCIKGNLMLGEGRNVSPFPGLAEGFSDFQFYFAGLDRNKLLMVSSDNRGATLTGEAIRVNPAP